MVAHFGLAENGYVQAAFVLAGQIQTVIDSGARVVIRSRPSAATPVVHIVATTDLLMRGDLDLYLAAPPAYSRTHCSQLHAPPFVAATRFAPLLLGLLYRNVVWAIAAPLLARRAIRLWLSLDLVCFALRRLRE